MKTHPITISVTRSHIRKGERVDCRKCPIALAIGEHYKAPFQVESCRVTFPLEEGRWHYASLSASAFDFICAFDDHCKVKPFEFVLEVPE